MAYLAGRNVPCVRVLGSFAGGRGHVEPLVPLARALRALGHDVVFACQPALVPDVESLGFTAHALGPSTVQTDRLPLMPPDRRHEAEVLRDVFAGRIARQRAAELVRLARAWAPDLVLTEEADFGAVLAAEALEIPSVVVSVLVAGTFADPAMLAPALDDARVELGLSPDPSGGRSRGDLFVVPAPPGFRDPSVPLPARACFMRPPAFDPRLDTRSPPVPANVYVTLGTIFNLESGDLFDRVLAGLSRLGVDVLATIGPHLEREALAPTPPRVRVERFVPQADVLPHCGAVVCHAGSGTLVGALAYGIPLVLLPMGADQLDNAARCEALGVGLVLDAVHAGADEVGDATRRVLSDPTYRARANDLRDELLALPDADGVAARCASLVRRLTP